MERRTPLESFVDCRLEALGLTRADLAAEMSIASLRTLSRKLSGQTQLSLMQARAMARLLDTTVEHICTLIEG